MSEVLISVITPVYNAERFIEATLKSLSSQTYKNFEALLVVDAKSSDNSERLCHDFAQEDRRFRVIKAPAAQGVGVSVNRNLGLIEARGEYVSFLDSDDLWLPEKIEKQLAFMREKKIDFSCTAFTKISEEGDSLGKEMHPYPRANYQSVLKNNRIGCLTVMMSTSLARQIRFQNIMHEDLAFWLSALRRTTYCYGLDLFLAQYRVVKGSRSNNKWIALKGRWNLLSRVEKLPMAQRLYYFTHYASSSLVKYF